MGDEDFRLFTAECERLEQECDTPEKATKQLQREGILDEHGRLAEPYRDPSEV